MHKQPAPGLEIEGRYRLERELARGGFGVVWLARHLRTGQRIAIKTLDADRAAARPGAVERFLREARITAALRHPNTVRVFDVGSGENGEPLYLAMEYLRGTTLEDALRALAERDLAMSEATAIDIALPVLSSLAEAHAEGLVHRDLKPGNLMFSAMTGDRPVVKVLDFGCIYMQGSELTVDGNIFGTPGYMSPEQIRGETVDGRSDLFALGLILYRCVAGRLPFDAPETLALLYRYSCDDVPDPRSVCEREISKPFAVALMRALARDPAKRYADAVEMREAFTAVRDAVRAGARSTRADGRDTMVGAHPQEPGDTLEALLRLCEEVVIQAPKTRTESDVIAAIGDTATYGKTHSATEVERTEAMRAPVNIRAPSGGHTPDDRRSTPSSDSRRPRSPTAPAAVLSAKATLPPTAPSALTPPAVAPLTPQAAVLLGEAMVRGTLSAKLPQLAELGDDSTAQSPPTMLGADESARPEDTPGHTDSYVPSAPSPSAGPPGRPRTQAYASTGVPPEPQPTAAPTSRSRALLVAAVLLIVAAVGVLTTRGAGKTGAQTAAPVGSAAGMATAPAAQRPSVQAADHVAPAAPTVSPQMAPAVASSAARTVAPAAARTVAPAAAGTAAPIAQPAVEQAAAPAAPPSNAATNQRPGPIPPASAEPERRRRRVPPRRSRATSPAPAPPAPPAPTPAVLQPKLFDE